MLARHPQVFAVPQTGAQACGPAAGGLWKVRCPLSVGGVCQGRLPAEQQRLWGCPFWLRCWNAPSNAFHPAAGQEECESAVSLLEEEARKLRRAQGALRLMPVPLYAGLPAAHQLEVFAPSPRGYRKVGQATSHKLQHGRAVYRAPGSSPRHNTPPLSGCQGVTLNIHMP